MNINKRLYNKFDLSTQAIILPTDQIKCLYFDFWGSDFIEIFYDFLKTICPNEMIYFSDAYRSNRMDRHFTTIDIEEFIHFINKKDYCIDIDGEKCTYNTLYYGGGMIITHCNLNWIIHRDPDFGTITFAYDNDVDTKTISLLRENKHFVSDSPKQSFYTDKW